MFTPGRIWFVAIFSVAFIVMLIWSYRKEARLNKLHFRKAYLVVIALLLFLIVQFLIVKMRKYM
jgi:hypothetical protein